MDLRDYLKILRRRKWVVLVAFLISASVYYLTAFRQPTRYRATALLIMKDLGLRDRILRMLSSVGPYAPSLDTQLQLMRQTKRLKRKVAERASRRLDLKITTEEVGGMVVVKQKEGTNMIEVIAQHINPKVVTVVATEYAFVSKAENKHLAQEEYQEARRYLEDQREQMSYKLTEAEERLRLFNQKHGVVEYNQALEREYDRYRTFQDELDQLALEGQAQMSLDVLLRRKSSSQDPFLKEMAIVPNPKRKMISERLFTLQMRMEDLKERYTEEHPRVVIVKKKIQKLQRELDTKIPKFITIPDVKANPMYSFWQQKLANKSLDSEVRKIKLGAMASLQDKAQKRIQVLGKDQVRYAQLLRNVKNVERVVNNVQDMLEQMKVTERTQSGNVTIIDVPKKAEKITAKTPEKILLSLLVSLFASILVGVVVEFIDDRLRSAHDVRRYLNLPVIGSVPRVVEQDRRLLYKIEQRSPLIEAYHKVCFQLESLCLDKQAKVTLITSIRSEEGKTTVLANVGTSLAQEGEKVLLVDGDIRKPALHRLFGLPNSVGLSSVLKGDVYDDMAKSVKAVIQSTPVDRLFLISGGPIVPNPVELLRSPQFAKFIQEVKDHADIVLLDSSPIAAVIDPMIMGSHLDGVLLLIDSMGTRRKEALTAKQQLTSLKVNIFGVILNNVLVGDEDYYYYYYYSSYTGGRKKKAKKGKLG